MLRRPSRGARSEPARALRCPAGVPDRVLHVESGGPHGDIAVLRVAGEIDLRSALTLRDHLDAVMDAGFGSVVVDFADVAFCDASGLNALVAAANRLSGRGGTVWLAGVRPSQRRLFTITGLDRRFPIVAGVADALVLADLIPGGLPGSWPSPENP